MYIMGGYNTSDTVVNLNPKYSDINYMSRFFLLMCNPQSCPAFSRPRNFGRRLLKFCPSFSSSAFSRPRNFGRRLLKAYPSFSGPAFSRPRNICLSFSSLSFSRPLVFFVRHFQVVHFHRPRFKVINIISSSHVLARCPSTYIPHKTWYSMKVLQYNVILMC